MKILHINSYYSKSYFYKNLYDQQVKEGLDIDVYVPVVSSFDDRVFEYGDYANISKCLTNHDRFFYHLKQNKLNNDIEKKYNINEYSLVHSHSLFTNGNIAMRLKKKYNIPYIVAVRNTDVNLFFKKMIHLRKRGVQILEEADRIIFLSPTYMEEVLNNYIPTNKKQIIIDKTSIVPNGIDDYWLSNSGFLSKEISNHIKLLHVGDINKNKNLTTTTKVLEYLNHYGFSSELNVVGHIKSKKIFNYISKNSKVNYLGIKQMKELKTIYRANDILVLPSLKETFGLVYAEAMSQGTPVIYTRGQGFDKQFIDGEIGYSVNPTDAGEISEKILSIIGKYSMLQKNCVKNCNKFSWHEINCEYIRIYKLIQK